MGRLIAIGACIGLIVVVMILMLGQTRVAFAMARDGLLPPALAKVHPTFRTPWVITAVTGIAVAIIGGLVDLETLVQLVSIGTLFAFVLVSLYPMANLTGGTWVRFLVWMGIGILV